MNVKKYVLSVLVITATLVACWAIDKPVSKEKPDEKIIVEGNNQFALELFAKLRERQGNLFFSPFSISTALAMTSAGARGNTEAQMAWVLHFPLPSQVTSANSKKDTAPEWNRQRFASGFGKIIKDLNTRGQKGNYELIVANALWGQKDYDFLKEFIELIKNNYDGQLHEVDFVTATETARQTINTWVEEKTKNKIKDLITHGVLNRLTRLVLTNAIYFKGKWASQFEKSKTKNASFTLLNSQKIDVAMMNQTEQFPYLETENIQVLELPYVNNDLSMVIFLPKKTDGLPEFEKTLTTDNLSQWLAGLHKCKVIVYLPKFKITSQFSMADVLKSMGMSDAFTPNVAEFSGMNGKKDLFISAVVHKAYVEVDEEGTEAAAATGVVVGITSAGPSKTPVFRADHPFLFLIRDNHTGSILFIGRVINPNA